MSETVSDTLQKTSEPNDGGNVFDGDSLKIKVEKQSPKELSKIFQSDDVKNEGFVDPAAVMVDEEEELYGYDPFGDKFKGTICSLDPTSEYFNTSDPNCTAAWSPEDTRRRRSL